jgi:hypothetical protein
MFGKPNYEYYELHQVERDELHEEWVWVRKESLKDIEGRRPALLFEFKDSRKRVCCETLYADDTYLANRRNPILVGETTDIHLLPLVGEIVDIHLPQASFTVRWDEGKETKSVVVTGKTKFCNGITIESLLTIPKQSLEKKGVPICVHYLKETNKYSEETDRKKKEITAERITAGNELIFMNAWYRRRQLGIENRIGEQILLSIRQPRWTGQAMWWQLRACARHPQITVLMSTVLAVVGTGLGIVGLAAVIKDLAEWNNITLFQGVCVFVGAVGIGIFVMGFRPLYLRAKLSRSDAKKKKK